MVLLVKVLVVSSVEHVLHLGLPQALLPGEVRAGGDKSALTSKSLKFLGRRKAMIGGVGNAFFNLSERWSRLWCFCVIVANGGRDGW